MLKFNLLKNKKGLSTIVVVLIIISLALVMVGVLWKVVKNITQESSEIELGEVTLDLDIKNVKIEDGNVTIVVLRKNSDEGEFVGINFIFSDGSDSEIIRENCSLQELEEKTFTFTLTKIKTSSLKSVSVAPIYIKSSGKEFIGNIADSFDVTEEMRAGITGEVSNFAALGYSGAGKMEYGPFTSDTPKLPEFKKAIVNPLDVLPGDNQTFTVHVYSPYNIVSVTSVTELDNSILYLDFEKIDEYKEDNETIEIWSANWIVNDTHTTEYTTKITATDSQGNENFVTLTWTDSCQSQLTHGTNDALTASCSTGTNAAAGLDGGSLTINSGVTLTIDSGATWGFNPGKSITVNGVITVNGQIKKGYLFYTDADGDGYAPNAVLTFSTSSSLSGKRRAKDISGTNDCYDNNANAKPGQTSYFTSHRGDGSFDYNCDGSQTKRYTSIGSCTDCKRVGGPGGGCGDIPGSVGWSSSVPNCGSSSWYITQPGSGCYAGGIDDVCSQSYMHTRCGGASRTQSCR